MGSLVTLFVAVFTTSTVLAATFDPQTVDILSSKETAYKITVGARNLISFEGLSDEVAELSNIYLCEENPQFDPSYPEQVPLEKLYDQSYVREHHKKRRCLSRIDLSATLRPDRDKDFARALCQLIEKEKFNEEHAQLNTRDRLKEAPQNSGQVLTMNTSGQLTLATLSSNQIGIAVLGVRCGIKSAP